MYITQEELSNSHYIRYWLLLENIFNCLSLLTFSQCQVGEVHRLSNYLCHLPYHHPYHRRDHLLLVLLENE